MVKLKSMRKSFIYLLIFLFTICLPVQCAESWDDYADLDKAWDGQKTITNKEFDEVMEALEAKKKKKEAKTRKKLIKKISGGGTSLHNELQPDKDIGELQKFKSDNDGVLLNIPVNIYADGKLLEKGYYKVVADKDKDGKAFINFYQSSQLCTRLQVNETNEDYGEDELDFAKVLPYDDNFVKLIFGSLSFNAYVIIPICHE